MEHPELPSYVDLKKMRIHVLSGYDVIEGFSGEVEFEIESVGAPLVPEVTPLFYYDGGAHAILIKNPETVVICNHIHPGVRSSVYSSKLICFIEKADSSSDEDDVVEKYTVEVIKHNDIEALAERLMRQKTVYANKQNSSFSDTAV